MLGAALAVAACGSSSKASGTTSTSSSSTTSTTASNPGSSSSSTTATTALTGPSVADIQSQKTVVVAGKTVTVPTDQGKPINADIDDGQQIIISSAGFLPAKLYSYPSHAIVWTNLTDQPQKISFDAFSVTSPVIAPGDTWSWTTQDSESIAYHSSSGLSAVVVVLPPGV
jgi:hypothetical protein